MQNIFVPAFIKPICNSDDDTQLSNCSISSPNLFHFSPGPFQLRAQRIDPLRERGNRVRDSLPNRRRRSVAGDDVVAVVYRLEVHGASRIPSSRTQTCTSGHEKCSTLTQSGIVPVNFYFDGM